MGFFSWTFCDAGPIRHRDGMLSPTKKQRLMIGSEAYLLVPERFADPSGPIYEWRYNGYGNFGGHDIYELVADWNREWLSVHPEWVRQSDIAQAKEMPVVAVHPVGEMSWFPFFSDLSLSRREVEEKWREAGGSRWGYEYRLIGIAIACCDEDNAALPFPIKVAGSPDSVYEDCPPSLSDPGQGCY